MKQNVIRDLFQLPKNSTILELYVNENDFVESDIYILAGFLHLCPKLEYFNSSHCGISSKEVKCLIECLPSLQLGWSELEMWWLNDNRIDDSTFEDLAIMIVKGRICLDNNSISNDKKHLIWQVS